MATEVPVKAAAQPPPASPQGAGITVPKRPYAPPKLTLFGDLRNRTMGASPGIGESGNPALFRA
ncbi:MAG TPA: hypothetical protein PK413_19570 [Thermoanaerobaculia bacterium]|nr:hypothetical protein [Thermoanaerobaculia bacterium]